MILIFPFLLLVPVGVYAAGRALQERFFPRDGVMRFTLFGAAALHIVIWACVLDLGLDNILSADEFLAGFWSYVLLLPLAPLLLSGQDRVPGWLMWALAATVALSLTSSLARGLALVAVLAMTIPLAVGIAMALRQRLSSWSLAAIVPLSLLGLPFAPWRWRVSFALELAVLLLLAVGTFTALRCDFRLKVLVFAAIGCWLCARPLEIAWLTLQHPEIVAAARKAIGRPAGIDTRLVTVWSVSPESASVFYVWVFNSDRSTSGSLLNLRQTPGGWEGARERECSGPMEAREIGCATPIQRYCCVGCAGSRKWTPRRHVEDMRAWREGIGGIIIVIVACWVSASPTNAVEQDGSLPRARGAVRRVRMLAAATRIARVGRARPPRAIRAFASAA